MLSEENRKRINENGLYYHMVAVELLPEYKRKMPFHCINWTFRPHFHNDEVIMLDTYFGNTFGIDVTDENIDEFTLLFDVTQVRRVSEKEAKDYDEKDLSRAPIDSSGKAVWFVRIDATPSIEKKIENIEYEIEQLNRQIQWKKLEIENLRSAK